MVGSLPAPVEPKPVRGDVAAPAFPPVLERAGTVACFAADEFFSARISNAETRRAYARAVGWFLEFCEREGPGARPCDARPGRPVPA